jgi:hypothetical protein
MNTVTEMDDAKDDSDWSAEIQAANEEADADDFASDEELAAFEVKWLAKG